MTKTYAVLHKKLQELELQLSHNNLTTIIHPSLSQEFHQKLFFVANLLTAEIASCPSKLKPRRLKHMARRLAQLEDVFWSPDLLDNGHVDDSSTCLCTESCLNVDSEVVSGSSCLEDEMEGGECFYECVEGEKEEKEERKIVGVGKLNGAMASGFVIGMVLIMGVAIFFIEFFGCFQDQQTGGFVIPT